MPAPHPENPQMVERFIWSVIYDDPDGGEIYEEYPSPTEHRSFTTVDVERVVRLILRPNHWLGAEGPTLVAPCYRDAEGARPIMFRTVAMNVDTGETARWHVFGWQKTVNGSNVKALLYLSDADGDDLVILTDSPLEVGG